ncbi:MAG: response regulator transcription factor [Bacteroidetes bacterium]|nr:response regulator transcription factor [Bacteroidota bacterium]
MAACLEQPDLHVVGEAQDGETAERGVRTLGPDVIITHALLPLRESQRFLMQSTPEERPWHCILLVPLHNAEAMEWAFSQAVDARLLTNDLPQHVIRTIRAVALGESFTCPLLAASEEFQRSGTLPEHAHELHGEREHAVFTGINQRKSTRAIAREHGLSPGEVGETRIRICEILHRSSGLPDTVPRQLLAPTTPLPSDDEEL